MSKREEIIEAAANRQLVKEASRARFVNEAAKEISSLKGQGMNMPKMVGVLVAAIGISQFVKRMISYAKEKHLEMQKPKYYEKMIEKNPELMEEDPQEVMDLWNTLYHHSPHMAQDPISAGAFITQNIQGRTRSELGGPTIDAYSTLNKIESDGVGSKQRRLDGDVDVTDALLAGIGLA